MNFFAIGANQRKKRGGDTMPSTGQSNDTSGIYRSTCCGYEIALSKNETFPPCLKCKKAADWVLVRRTN